MLEINSVYMTLPPSYFYFEYAVPDNNREELRVVLSGFVPSRDSHVANRMIKKIIGSIYPNYKEYDHGEMLFYDLVTFQKLKERGVINELTEGQVNYNVLEDNREDIREFLEDYDFKFTSEDWEEYLERITFDKDESIEMQGKDVKEMFEKLDEQADILLKRSEDAVILREEDRLVKGKD